MANETIGNLTSGGVLLSGDELIIERSGTNYKIAGANSIVDSANLPGSPTTTTQSANDNSTKIATTAYVDTANANYVAKSLYDANTILKADSDNTPIALTVANSTFLGRTSSSSITAMTVSEAKTELGAGSANGLATLDPAGKIPASQLPNSVMEYKGTWDASTNTPTLADGTGNAGDVYIVNVAGTQNLGSGPITFAVGDWVIYNGSIWQKSMGGSGIVSLNGLTTATQTFATGTTGTNFAISSSGSTHTFNLPDASATATGVVTTGTQTIAGLKTFSNPEFRIGDVVAPLQLFQYEDGMQIISGGSSISVLDSCVIDLANASTITSTTGNALTITADCTLDQNLATTASPTYNGLTLTGLTASNFITTDASKNLVSTSPSSATALLSNFVGDSGSGGVKGLVPAPAAGDSTKFLKGDGTWATVTSSAINNKVYYVSTVGNDSNVGYDINKPFLTLAAALTAAGGSGNQICILPGTYAGNTTISQANVTITGFNDETSGIVNLTGTITVSTATSSVRIQGVSMNNLVHTGACSLYLRASKVNTATTLSSSGYFYSESCDFQGNTGTGTITVSGTGNKVFTGNCLVGFLTVSNASAIVNVSNNLIAAPMTITAGVLGINNTPVYAATNGGNAITATNVGTTVILKNVSVLNPNNTVGKVSFGAGVFYSFNNITYDNTSTNSGTRITSIGVFDKVTSDAFNASGLTASTALALDANKDFVSVTNTGTGNNVLATSPTITTPAITFSTTAALTAGTNAQGQGAITTDNVVVTTAANNPSGVTLPTATVGRFISIKNRGANPINVYPATGASIDQATVNSPLQIPVNGIVYFRASSTTQWYSTAFSTLIGPTLTLPTISEGLIASGSGSNNFSGSTGAFQTSSGANTFNGAATINDATTPSLTTAAGKTNTGFLQVNGKTSGALRVTTADATAETLTVSAAAQTVGAATITIPNVASVSDTFALTTLSQTLSNKTLDAAGNITVATGSTLRTGTSSGNTLNIGAYDVDLGAYRTYIVLTAGNTPSIAMSKGPGSTFTIDGAVIGPSNPAEGSFTGLSVGFTATPTASQIAIGDANCKLTNNTTVPTVQFDTNDLIQYTRSSNTYAFQVGGASYMTLSSTAFALDTDLFYADLTNNRIGVGTTTPNNASVDIEISYTNDHINGAHGYLDSTGAGTGGDIPAVPVSLYGVQGIHATVFRAFSDERMKTDIQKTDSSIDLNVLNQIQIVDYKYKDKVARGDKKHKKVIAQQVEQVYPEAVLLTSDAIPDIYKKADKAIYNKDLKELQIFLENHDVKVGEKIKFIFRKTTSTLVVKQANEDFFVVDCDSEQEEVFVYGRRVDDFRTVDYEAISMLNVSATQELFRLLEKANKKISELERKIELLN